MSLLFANDEFVSTEIAVMVGLPGFGPGSRAPEAHSLDHASRQPLANNCLLC